MLDTTSKAEPSELVKASPLLMSLWEGENAPREEVERRALGAQRLSTAFSSIAWHTRKSANQPDYWNVLYASQVNR